jgi:hypothetical protein
MQNKMTGLLGAVAALGALSAVQAAPAPEPSDALKVSSFAELLQPIPNAAAQLKAMDEAQPAERTIQLAYHHHHHHHRYWRRRHHHHHHHHHY